MFTAIVIRAVLALFLAAAAMLLLWLAADGVYLESSDGSGLRSLNGLVVVVAAAGLIASALVVCPFSPLA